MWTSSFFFGHPSPAVGGYVSRLLAGFKSASRLVTSWLRQPTCRLLKTVNRSANGTYRLVISRQILATHSSTDFRFLVRGPVAAVR